MWRIATNSAAAGGRSTELLLLLLFVTDRLRTSLGSNDSLPIAQDPKYKWVHPDHREFIVAVDAQRVNTSTSIIDFMSKVYRHRIRLVSEKPLRIPKVNKGILYWMNRDHRVQDNWALLNAQKLAIQNKVPLHVVFCSSSRIVDMSIRQYKFMCAGLRKVEFECQTLNIEFHRLIGNSTETLSNFVRNRALGAIVVDFSPLRDDKLMLKQLVLAIGSEVPVIQVDAHNIVPCWLLAEQQIPANRGKLRKRMNKILGDYLTEFPPVIEHPYTAYPKAIPTDWKIDYSSLQIDLGPKSKSKFKAGYLVAMGSLNNFITKKLENYETDRTNPLIDGLSNLSPWLHFGQISAQRVLLEVRKFNNTYPKSVYAYNEEIYIRRELLENYCYYNSKYDSIEGGPAWGLKTLNDHRNDTRYYLYTRDEFEKSHTRDFLWNAANNQMIKDGKTHRFLRPYWAKKILEFSKTPEEAIATANYLNNKYSSDGNDPSGYGGILWAMTGLYDQDVKPRKVFGKVRDIDGLTISANFNTSEYIPRYLTRYTIRYLLNFKYRGQMREILFLK